MDEELLAEGAPEAALDEAGGTPEPREPVDAPALAPEGALAGKLAEIRALDPEVNGLDDLLRMPNFAEFDRLVRRGCGLTEAYKLANFDRLSERRSAAARQAAMNALRGKRHLTATGGGAGEDVAIPQETLELYRAAFPQWSDRRILADYKKHK